MEHFIKKISLMLLMGMQGLQGAMPAAKQISTVSNAVLVNSISANLKSTQAILKRLTEQPQALAKALLSCPQLEELNSFSQEFLDTLRAMEGSDAEAPVQQGPQVANQSLGAMAAVQHKTGVEPAKTKLDMTVGTNTGNLMAKNPKFGAMMKIGNLTKQLAEMSADQNRLGKYVSKKRTVTAQENLVLNKFQNASKQKIAKFVEYLKALATGDAIASYHKRFHVGSVSGNAFDALNDMELVDLQSLHALLTELVPK